MPTNRGRSFSRVVMASLFAVASAVACSSSSDEETGVGAGGADASSEGAVVGANDGGPVGQADAKTTPLDATFEGGKVVLCSGIPDSGGVTFTQICGLKMPLTGAVNTTLDTLLCGHPAPDTLNWDGTSSAGKYAVRAVLQSALPLDTVGVFPLKSLTIAAAAPDTSSWQTPDGACALTISTSECKPSKQHPQQRVVSGTGSCSQPAAPQGATAGGPIDIGSFTFLVAFDP